MNRYRNIRVNHIACNCSFFGAHCVMIPDRYGDYMWLIHLPIKLQVTKYIGVSKVIKTDIVLKGEYKSAGFTSIFTIKRGAVIRTHQRNRKIIKMNGAAFIKLYSLIFLKTSFFQ